MAECSTPFGITEVGTGRVAHGCGCDGDVLNAFRHHRGGHSRPGASPGRRTTVLNAFRHHRGGHTFAASPVVRFGPCSTPFGITEVGTRIPRPRKPRFPCAQRLSASQRWAPSGLVRGLRLKLGAQRLSASQRWALASRGRESPDSRVLNAFRHHRGGHPPASSGGYGLNLVLNAFRHHRGGHHLAAGASAVFVLCSTPFGITEVGTS